MRVFAAVLVQTEALRALISRLPAARQLKPVAPESTHVTLKFLGEVPEHRVAHLCGALERAAGGFGSFLVALRGVGAFPSARNPRVVWAGVGEGAERLEELQRRVEREMVALGFQPERRRFKPHVTLARVKGRCAEAAEFVRRNSAAELGEVRVGEVHLMRSLLMPSGARYSSLCAVPLE